MTGKRKADVSPGSPSHKAVRGEYIVCILLFQALMLTKVYLPVTSESDRIIDLSSSLPVSAELLSLQPPLASQLDESNTTNKSFNDISDNERSQWRQLLDPKSFSHYIDIAPIAIKALRRGSLC